MKVINYLIKQSANPSGFIGSMMTKIWSGYFKDLSKWSLMHINLNEYKTILDIGFGGGSNIKYISEQNLENIIYGIDISEESLKTAKKLNQGNIDKGRVILDIGDVIKLQFKEEFFDLVIANQTHIYWEKLKIGLSECHRVLKKDGIFLISCEIDKIKYHLSEYLNNDDFLELLLEIGFKKVDVEATDKYVVFICVK